MKAAQYDKHGGPEVIEIKDVYLPEVAEGQILVEVYAASINPIDYKVRLGYLQGIPSFFPSTLGGDFAGVVRALGAGVSEFKVGDEVYGQAGILNGGSGSIAEMANTSVGKASIKPNNLNFEESASLPLAGISALQAIEDSIRLQPGQKILIHGGAGGIGSFAIQIAKANGAYVAVTVSSDDMEFVKKLGADEIIDYKSHDFSQILKDFDAVFDTAGKQTWEGSFKVLKRGGVIVSMSGQPHPEEAEKFGIISIGQGTDANPDRLERLRVLVESGKVKPEIDKIFSFNQVREAFKYQENQSPRGKVVIKVKN